MNPIPKYMECSFSFAIFPTLCFSRWSTVEHTEFHMKEVIFMSEKTECQRFLDMKPIIQTDWHQIMLNCCSLKDTLPSTVMTLMDDRNKTIIFS